jgi:hypothetical protein
MEWIDRAGIREVRAYAARRLKVTIFHRVFIELRKLLFCKWQSGGALENRFRAETSGGQIPA